MRLLTLSVILLGWCLSIQAQRGLKVGFFGVPNASYLINADDNDLDDDLYSPEALPSMAGGITLGVGIGDFFGIRFSPTYTRQGGAYTALTGLESRTRFVERLDYARLPLLIGLNTSPISEKLIFSFYVGGSADLLTRVRSFNDNPLLQLLPPDGVTLPSPNNRYEPVVYSLMAETGFEISLPPDNFQLNLRLYGAYGLTDAEDKSARVRIVEGTNIRNESYWQYARGGTRNADTNSLNVGILIGLTYVFQRTVPTN